MTDERVWLQHGEHGGHFHCPAEAVEDFEERGWQRTDDPPPEDNPVVAELLAAQQAAAERAAQEPNPAGRRTRKAKDEPSRDGGDNTAGVIDG